MVIYLGCLQPRKSFALAISGLPSSKAVMRLLRNAHLVNTFILKCPPCQHPFISVGPFSKWGIDFMHCKPTSAGGHRYIIVAIDYFTKWTEAMPTYAEYGKTVAHHIIAIFGVSMSAFKQIPRLFVSSSTKYDSIHVITMI